MEKQKIDSPNGKQRRTLPERRSGDRRDPEREAGKGTLTTRVKERRQKVRREADKKSVK